MAFNIYKPGQGYWTRLLSGLAGGLLVVTAAYWLWTVIEGYSLKYGIYVQAAVAVAIITLCGLLIFRWVAVKPASVDFLIATEGEMKKVNWPTRREVIGSTGIVIIFLAFISILLFGSDGLFYMIFKFFHVLDI